MLQEEGVKCGIKFTSEEWWSFRTFYKSSKEQLAVCSERVTPGGTAVGGPLPPATPSHLSTFTPELSQAAPPEGRQHEAREGGGPQRRQTSRRGGQRGEYVDSGAFSLISKVPLSLSL